MFTVTGVCTHRKTLFSVQGVYQHSRKKHEYHHTHIHIHIHTYTPLLHTHTHTYLYMTNTLPISHSGELNPRMFTTACASSPRASRDLPKQRQSSQYSPCVQNFHSAGKTPFLSFLFSANAGRCAFTSRDSLNRVMSVTGCRDPAPSAST
jgi:hypothetical protein